MSEETIVIKNGQSYSREKLGNLEIDIPVPEVFLASTPDGIHLNLNKLPNTVSVTFTYSKEE